MNSEPYVIIGSYTMPRWYFGRWTLGPLLAGEDPECTGWQIWTNDAPEDEVGYCANECIAELGPTTEDRAKLLASADALAAALRAVVEYHEQSFTDGILNADLNAEFGDPPAIAEARKALAELDA